MPLYEFSCPDHGSFDRFVEISKRNEGFPCPRCREVSPRIFSAPRLALMSSVGRMAAERNERSRQEPRVTKGGPSSRVHQCGSGACGKQSGEGRRRGSYRGSRPWVIEHK